MQKRFSQCLPVGCYLEKTLLISNVTDDFHPGKISTAYIWI